MVNTQNSSKNIDFYDYKSNEELQEIASNFTKSGETEKAMKILTILSERSKTSVAEVKQESFEKRYEEFLKTLDDKKLTKDKIKAEIQAFLKGDVQTYTSGFKTDLEAVGNAKEDEIAKLRGQLDDITSTDFKTKEMFSLKRYRMVAIKSKHQKFKDDAENYPKNFLIYAMGLVKNKFGVGQGLKRTRVKATWKWKSDDILGGLENLDNMMNSSDSDGLLNSAAKTQLKEAIKEAKNAYVKKQASKLGVADQWEQKAAA